MGTCISANNKKTPKELARENKRVIDKSIRYMDREKNKLEKDQTKCLSEIKKLAEKNQH